MKSFFSSVRQMILALFTIGAGDATFSQQYDSQQYEEPTVNSHILVVGTGGTIAGTASSAKEGLGYQSGALTINDMLDTLPGARKLASFTSIQISNIGSQDMTEAVWFKLARLLSKHAADGEIDGFIITHGTDTLEETAFFLEQVYSGSKPVVLTAAMRPADAVSADGPGNMINAIKAVNALKDRGRRVIIAMNGQFHEPRFATKRHTENTNAIQSINGGLAGEIVNGRAIIYNSTIACGQPSIDLDGVQALPYIPIFYMHVGHRPEFVAELVRGGARGIVTAGYGNGNTGEAMVAALAAATQMGVTVVRSSRVGAGYVSRNVEINDDEHGFIAAYDLNPQKARIILALGLLEGITGEALQKRFVRAPCS